MENNRAQWGSKIGFILAAAGSAVGLGNIWKFPGKAFEGGGGAYILIYLAIVVLIGFPVMLSELTIGRAARNADGLVILYADTVTPSMKRAMDETERRRAIQDKYNKEHGIVPQTIRKDVREIIEISRKDEDGARRRGKRKLSERERDEEIRKLEKQMQEASRMLEFEYAAVLRDRIIELRKEQK